MLPAIDPQANSLEALSLDFRHGIQRIGSSETANGEMTTVLLA